MFEDLEKEFQRQNKRLDESVFKSTIVSNIEELRRVLSEIDPNNSKAAPEVELAAVLNAVEDGKNNMYRVTTKTKSKSKREILIEGMDLVKRQIEANDLIVGRQEAIEVNGVYMKPPKFGKGGKGETWVDPLIRHWLGGYRSDLMICWDLDDFQYRYDIYGHKLSRTRK